MGIRTVRYGQFATGQFAKWTFRYGQFATDNSLHGQFATWTHVLFKALLDLFLFDLRAFIFE